jgi:hypothetical protein
MFTESTSTETVTKIPLSFSLRGETFSRLNSWTETSRARIVDPDRELDRVSFKAWEGGG